MIPTEEKKAKILEAQMENPDILLGSAEQFLLTLSSISELRPRLTLWAFKLDYEGIEAVSHLSVRSYRLVYTTRSKKVSRASHHVGHGTGMSKLGNPLSVTKQTFGKERLSQRSRPYVLRDKGKGNLVKPHSWNRGKGILRRGKTEHPTELCLLAAREPGLEDVP